MADTPAPRKSVLKSPWTWVGVAVIALVGGAYLLYRQNKNAQAAASSTTTTGTPSDETDYAGQIGTLQAEIADLQGTLAQQSGTTSSVTVTVPAVEGKSIDAAKAAITGAGLVPKLNTATAGGTTYVITSQTPGAGSKVPAGSTVDLAAGVATGAGGTSGGGGSTSSDVLPAPGKASVTPHAGGADIGGGSVPGAKAYEIVVQGATGPGTGTSHYDHVSATNHADVSLTPGRYITKSRAGTSAANVHGHWSADTSFTVPKSSGSGQTHPGGSGTPPAKTGPPKS